MLILTTILGVVLIAVGAALSFNYWRGQVGNHSTGIGMVLLTAGVSWTISAIVWTTTQNGLLAMATLLITYTIEGIVIIIIVSPSLRVGENDTIFAKSTTHRIIPHAGGGGRLPLGGRGTTSWFGTLPGR